jgi:hypothetical protein
MSGSLRVLIVVLGLVVVPAGAFAVAKSQPSHTPPGHAGGSPAQQQTQTEPSLAI